MKTVCLCILRMCILYSYAPILFPAAEIGDYDEMADREFLKANNLLPNQERAQEKIMELHRRHL